MVDVAVGDAAMRVAVGVAVLAGVKVMVGVAVGFNAPVVKVQV